MGPKDARLAAELLNVPLVIPIHYNTWPLIAQDPEAFKKEVKPPPKAKCWWWNRGRRWNCKKRGCEKIHTPGHWSLGQ